MQQYKIIYSNSSNSQRPSTPAFKIPETEGNVLELRPIQNSVVSFS